MNGPGDSVGDLPGRPGVEAVAEHWGAVDDDLLYDLRRYFAWARAHHVAGHHWGLWRLEETVGPAGLSLGLPRRLDVPTRADVEATAVLIEALGVEYLRGLWRIADFGFGLADLDWDSLRDHIGLCWREARARGCRFTMQAAPLLGDETWLRDATWYAVRDWDEISALADALGRGRVLEADEVAGVLRWW